MTAQRSSSSFLRLTLLSRLSTGGGCAASRTTLQSEKLETVTRTMTTDEDGARH